jgi:ABC-2 type transport system ATP-binding protein
VAGLVPWRRREQNALNIGVVFGQRSQLWWDLPLIESFKLIAKMYHVERGRYEANLAHFRALLDLDEFITTPVRQLSLGQRMRGDLAAALIYDPRIVYLDEPTVGLDVLAKERIRTFIEAMNHDRQTTVILTTHDLGDVERLCRRIILIDQGKVLYDGPIARLKAAYAPHRLLAVQFAANGTNLAMEQPPLDVPGAEFVRWEDGKAWLRFDPASMAAHTLIAAVTERYSISDLSIVEPELEDVIRQIYEQRQVVL